MYTSGDSRHLVIDTAIDSAYSSMCGRSQRVLQKCNGNLILNWFLNTCAILLSIMHAGARHDRYCGMSIMESKLRT